MNVKNKDTHREFFKRERQKFKGDISNPYWKKYWGIAILKVIHKKKGLEPSMDAFFSLQRLQYIDEMSYKIERGLQLVKFNDEWVKILKERGIWNH